MYVGIDLVEIDRIEKSIQSQHFIKRVFSEEEIAYANQKYRPVESFAAFFAAKEAFGKALGIGISGLPLKEVSIIHTKEGKPLLELKGKVLDFAKERNLSFDISLTHTHNYANAVVIAFKKER